MKTISVLKVKLMIVMRISKEIIILMKKRCKIFVLSLPTVLHNIEGPSVSPALVLNIAPEEGQIPVSNN